jgi:uncharacterized repeat protein (TIGR03943 family)
MKRRAYRTLQALILATLGLLTLILIWEGTVLSYLGAAMIPLELLAGFGLLALAQAALSARGQGEGPLPDRAGWKLALLALPILLAAVALERPLGAAALGGRLLNPRAAAIARSGLPAPSSLPPEERNLRDWAAAMAEAPLPADLNGLPASVNGFVAHDARLGRGRFWLARYAVGGGLGGALAYAAAVDWPAAGDFPDDEWVRVEGTMDALEWDGRAFPLIHAQRVVPIQAPTAPYLAP